MDLPETHPPVVFETHPARYRHWRLAISDEVARLSMDVKEDGGLLPGYALKLNSYDLGVDIELADAVQRIRFEHPGVKAVVLESVKEKAFCAGANIFMLGGSSHPFKVNFCKFTNETRLSLEDASAHSGLKFLAAVNGACAGGGYELALACDEIFLVDDGNSAVSLPEVPLLGVLPGTGGLTRVVDKRRVRRDHADVFCTTTEGIKGTRAVAWRLVDRVVPKSKFEAAVEERARALAALSDRSAGPGIALAPLACTVAEDTWTWKYVSLRADRERGVAEIEIRGPDGQEPETPEAFLSRGCDAWALRAFRELDASLLQLRFNDVTLGTLVLRTRGDPGLVLAADRAVDRHRDHWLVREILHHQKRVLKRLDLTARSSFAFVDSGSCFAGVLAELALSADRTYMLDDPGRPTAIALGPLNGGLLPMANGLSRLSTRLLCAPEKVAEVLAAREPFGPKAAVSCGLATFAPDEIDWDDEVRVALEERHSLSPDALTGMEANLRFAGPETLETKIFGRLSAWQNWIFIRPNATGERGALTVYGKSGRRPEFDLRRT
jgi:benzoyl-CoA-dihydrodiol lyase